MLFYYSCKYVLDFYILFPSILSQAVVLNKFLIFCTKQLFFFFSFLLTIHSDYKHVQSQICPHWLYLAEIDGRFM